MFILLISTVLNGKIEVAQFQSNDATNRQHHGRIPRRIEAKTLCQTLKHFQAPNQMLNVDALLGTGAILLPMCGSWQWFVSRFFVGGVRPLSPNVGFVTLKLLIRVKFALLLPQQVDIAGRTRNPGNHVYNLPSLRRA
jgi:hypothetical protein